LKSSYFFAISGYNARFIRGLRRNYRRQTRTTCIRNVCN